MSVELMVYGSQVRSENLCHELQYKPCKLSREVQLYSMVHTLKSTLRIKRTLFV